MTDWMGEEVISIVRVLTERVGRYILVECERREVSSAEYLRGVGVSKKSIEVYAMDIEYWRLGEV